MRVRDELNETADANARASIARARAEAAQYPRRKRNGFRAFLRRLLQKAAWIAFYRYRR